MKRYALSVILVLLFALKLCAQNTGVQQFNVRTYGAKGDGTTDDDVAIQKAVTAAAAFTAATPGSIAEVLVPRGVYIIDVPITITGDRIKLKGDGVIKTESGTITMQSMIDVTGDDFTCEGITIDANDSGPLDNDGNHCLRVAGTNNLIRGVTVKNALDTGFQVHEGSLRTTIRDCISDSCAMGLRVAGDYCSVDRLFVYDFSAEKGATIDPKIGDAQFFSMTNSYFHTLQDTWECFVLVDTGDGGMEVNLTTSEIVCGTATSVGGYATYTIAAGHGYQPGDAFWVISSGIGVVSADDWDRAHKISKVTGNKVIRVLSSTTFALYDTAENARNTDSTTGRLDIVDDSSNTESVNFYVTTPMGGRRTIAVTGGLDYTNDVFTTSDAHNFQTGEPARITPHNRLHILPTGIAGGGTVTLKTPYSAAGSASTAYFRPKRIEQVVISNVVCMAPNESLNDGNLIKVHNCNNLLVEGTKLQNPLNKSISDANDAGTADDEYYNIQALRLGGNVRQATVQNTTLGNGLISNIAANVTSFLAENVTFGDGANRNAYCLEQFQMQNAVFRNCIFRPRLSVIDYEMRDWELEWLEFDNCRLEAENATNSVAWLDATSNIAIVPKLRMGGKIFMRPNCTRVNSAWPGSSVSTFTDSTDVVTMSTAHTLEMGDTVYFTTTGSLPANVVANTLYYFRPTSNTAGTLHTSREACSDAAATPFNLGSGSGSSCLMHTPSGKLGTSLTDSSVTDLIARCLGSPLDLYDITTGNATSGSFVLALKSGTRIWNPNAGRNSSPGWIVTKEGTIGSTANVLQAMPMLNSTFTANITELGNVGTGEDNLLTYSLPASTLAATGDSIEIEAGFTFANNTATKQVKIFIGSNEIYASGASAHQSGALQFRAVVVRDAVNTAKVSLFATANGSNTPFPIAYGNAFAQSSIDWSTALTIKGTGEATSNNDVVMEYLRVRAFPAAPP
jgi:hypothetical protein